jgi:general secretion pathway protein I
VRSNRGFTLLEVMVATAILGLGLTAILSAQAGSFAASTHSRNLSVATGLARCRMSELEEQLARDGFQELEVNETGPCCDGEDIAPVRCSWKVQKPELPEAKLGELDLDTDIGSGQLGALSALGGEGDSAGLPDFGGDAGVGALAAAVTGGAAPGDAAGAAGGLAAMAMGFVYPDLKMLFEQSTRRVTVTMSWTEGTREHSFDVVQWITAPQDSAKLDALENAAAADAADQAESLTPSPGSTGTGSTPPKKPPNTNPFAPKR